MVFILMVDVRGMGEVLWVIFNICSQFQQPLVFSPSIRFSTLVCVCVCVAGKGKLPVSLSKYLFLARGSEGKRKVALILLGVGAGSSNIPSITHWLVFLFTKQSSVVVNRDLTM